jgi:hypothetical protein
MYEMLFSHQSIWLARFFDTQRFEFTFCTAVFTKSSERFYDKIVWKHGQDMFTI